MTQRTEQIALLEEEILREEKRFLMEKYAALLLLQAELAESEAAAEGGEPVGLEDCVVESLQVAHAYVNPEMAVQISELLEAHGHEIEVSDSESGDGEHDSAEETDDLLGANGDDETAADEETESLFDDSDEPDSLIETTDAEDVVEAGSPDGLAEPAEQEGEGLFDDAEAAPQEDGASEPAGEGADEDEEAGVLFADDIYSGNEGEARDRGSEEGAGGFTPTEGHEQEETPGFTPTKRHEQQDTPG